MTRLDTVRPLRTEEDYDAALAAIRPYFDNEPEPGSPEDDHFEMLALVIGKYEDEHYPIGSADPVEVIKFVMDAKGYNQGALADVLGSRSRASEILSRKRDLSVDQIRRLHKAWNIPTDALIG